MKSRATFIKCSAMILSVMALSAAPVLAQKKTVKECQQEWQANKAANQANKITEKAYVEKCRAGSDTAPGAAPTPKASTSAPAASPATTMAKLAAASKSKDGRQAEYARECACGKDWKADKAAGKVHNASG